MEKSELKIDLEEICQLIGSGKAIVIRYEKAGEPPIIKKHPEEISNEDTLILNPFKRIMERKAYCIRCEKNDFYLSEVPVFFGNEDIPDIVREMFKEYIKKD